MNNVTIWHNLVGILIGAGVIALGRFALAKARRMADITIDFETQYKRSPKDWGSELNREAEASFNRTLGWVVIGVGTVFGFISAVQLLHRLLT